MKRTLLKRMALHALLLLVVSVVLFSEGLVSFSSPAWLRSIAIEVRAACRDSGTQWMVFLCAGIYFVTFTILSKRGVRNAECGVEEGGEHPTTNNQHRTSSASLSPWSVVPWSRSPNSGPHFSISAFQRLLSYPGFWLCAFLLIAALRYAFDYDRASTSTQALMLLIGAAIGKGARLWVNWGVSGAGCQVSGAAEHPTTNTEHPTSSEGSAEPTTKHTNDTKAATEGIHSLAKHSSAEVPVSQPQTWNLELGTLLSVLLLLLAVASLWHPEGAMQFQYRGLNRWSGPWDNPNIYGLLMGTGVVIGAGLFVSSFGLRVSSSPPGRGKGWVVWRWLWRVVLLACIGCCAVGLLKSYSRGAWLGTAVGLGLLVYQVFKFRVSDLAGQPLTPSLSPSDGERVTEGRVGGRLSCGSCASWLKRNRRPLAILLACSLVLAFWQFRFTQFHPVRRAFSVGNQNDFSWRNRVAAWEGSLAMMADKPVTGFGWNQPERIYDQFYRPPKVSEGMAIQLNHYFIVGMSLGLPALTCFLAYIGLSLTRNWERGKANSKPETRNPKSTLNLQPATCNPQLHEVCLSAAVVLLIGLWFDGGLFNLATGALLWMLLELGSGTALPACRGKEAKETGLRGQEACVTTNLPLHEVGCASSISRMPSISRFQFLAVPLLIGLLLLTGLLWAKARDPFHREWLSLKASGGGRFRAVAVMPDGGGPFPVVVWCHGSGGSLEGDGETLRQFAALGLAAVGFEYDKTNQAGFDAQFAAVLDAVAQKSWAAKAQLTQSVERGVRNSPLETRNPKLETPSKHPTSNIQQPPSNAGQSAEVNGLNGERLNEGSAPERPNHQSSIVNHKSLAWAGNSLGAQRQLSFLVRHPERQPMALVRLNGGMVEEMRAHPTSNIEQPTSNAGEPTPDPSQEGNFGPEIWNLKLGIPLSVWIAHGGNDEVFPVADARLVAEALRSAGAEVRLDVVSGRGHSFGEDQPLLVRRAAEFCARELGATARAPDNVRPARGAYWAPVVLLVAGLLGRKWSAEDGFRPRAASSRWLRLTAVATAAAALVVSGAHWLLPLLPANPVTLRFARQWCVQPGVRADFDWLGEQPEAKGCQIAGLLEHLNLASLQRGKFGVGLSDADWRQFVLSPWVAETGKGIAWRRELWEWLAPRVRRETDTVAVAQIVVRELRNEVLAGTARPEAGILETWSLGVANPVQREILLCAMLRSVGVPARIGAAGACEMWSGSQWMPAPKPTLPDL